MRHSLISDHLVNKPLTNFILVYPFPWKKISLLTFRLENRWCVTLFPFRILVSYVENLKIPNHKRLVRFFCRATLCHQDKRKNERDKHLIGFLKLT